MSKTNRMSKQERQEREKLVNCGLFLALGAFGFAMMIMFALMDMYIFSFISLGLIVLSLMRSREYLIDVMKEE